MPDHSYLAHVAGMEEVQGSAPTEAGALLPDLDLFGAFL